MTNAQLELSFGALRVHPMLTNTRRPSIRNPQWWFQRMRQIVDRALDWQPAPPPRPEQIDFPGRDFRLWTA
jgi:hypothetical protein